MEDLQRTEMAFPVATVDGYIQYGMTLRDYFAAKTMASLMSSKDFELAYKNANFVKEIGRAEYLASQAYQFADAMLEQRNETPKLFSERVVLPRVIAERDALIVAFKEVLRISDRKHDAWDDAKALIARIEAKNGYCTCPAYKFPHRLYSGKCAGHESKPDAPLDFDNRNYVSSTQRDYDDAGMKVSDFI